jgi:hypothetical protein
MKYLISAVVGAFATVISHLIWQVRTPLAAFLRWVAAASVTHVVLNDLVY